MKKMIFCMMLFVCLASCSSTYLMPATAYNTRHTVQCKGNTYAQCITKFVNVKEQYERQLDEIYKE